MLRFALRALGALVALAAFAVLTVTFTDTKIGPLPDAAPGYRVLSLKVVHRPNPLALHLWYPADQGDIQLIGQNALFYGFHARPEAPAVTPAAGQGGFPLVLLSHGSGGNAERLGWIAAELAKAGFIVAAVNHPGTTSGDSLPARTVMPWERVADLRAILNQLESAPPADLRPDLARVGALGFSLGGGSVLLLAGARLSKAEFIAYCAANAGHDDCGWLAAGGVDFTAIDAALYEQDFADPRLRAVAAIDPALTHAMTAESLPRLPPTLVLNLGTAGTIPLAMQADHLAKALPQGDYLTVPGAAHFSFLARCSPFGVAVIAIAGDDNICSDHGLRPRAEVHSDLARALITFFSERL